MPTDGRVPAETYSVEAEITRLNGLLKTFWLVGAPGSGGPRCNLLFRMLSYIDCRRFHPSECRSRIFETDKL